VRLIVFHDQSHARQSGYARRCARILVEQQNAPNPIKADAHPLDRARSGVTCQLTDT